MKLIICLHGEPKNLAKYKYNVETQFLSFESTRHEDLLVIAKNRIIDVPCSLLLSNTGKILLRVNGIVPKTYVNRMVAC